MKFRRVYINGFGRYEDFEMSFDDKVGLHVIYGPNEAGKSTFRHAILDFLFGIEQQTTFVQSEFYGDVRIGAEIVPSSGESFFCMRRKGRKETLIDASEEPINQDILSPYLRGLDRRQYELAYGLNQRVMREGSSLLATQDQEAGQTIFAASLGNVQPRKVEEQLKSRAEALFKPRASVPAINALLKTFKDIKKSVREALLSRSDWEEKAEAVRNLEADLAAIADRDAERKPRLEYLKAILAAQEDVRALAGKLKHAEEMGEVVMLYGGFEEKFSDLRDRKTEQEIVLREKMSSVERARWERADIAIDEEVLSHTDAVLALDSRVSAIRQDREQTETLRQKAATTRNEARRSFSGVFPGFDDEAPEQFRLSSLQTAELKQHVQDWRTLLTKQEQVAASFLQAQSEQQHARLALDALPEPKDTDALAAIIPDAQTAHAREQDALNSEEKEAEFRLERDSLLADMRGMWSGSIEELEALVLPPVASVEADEERLTELKSSFEQAEAATKDQQTELRRLNDSIAEMEATGPVPTRDQLLEARQHRDAGWQRIRDGWLSGDRSAIAEVKKWAGEDTPEVAFDAALKNADEISDKMLEASERVAVFAQLQVKADRARTRLGGLEAEKEAARREYDGFEETWSQQWRALGCQRTEPKALRIWRAQRLKVIETEANRQAAERHEKQLNTTIAERRKQLREALIGFDAKLDEAATLRQLIDQANSVIKAETERQKKRGELESNLRHAETALSQSQQQQTTLAQQLDGLRATREGLLSATGWQGISSPDVLEQLMASANAAWTLWDESSRLEREAQSLDTRVENFEASVLQLVDMLGQPEGTQTPEEQVKALAEIVETEQRKLTKREGLTKSIDDLETELATLQTGIDSLLQSLDELTQEAGCNNLDEIPAAIERSNTFRTLQQDIEQLRQRVRQNAGEQNLEAFAAEVLAADVDTVRREALDIEEALVIDRKAAEAKRQELGRVQEKREQLRKQQPAAELQQELAQTAAEIIRHAQEYRRVKLAAVLLKREMERYRHEHQAPLLGHASKLFQELTEGAYTQVEVRLDDSDKRLLYAVPREEDRFRGGRVEASQLSDGTRDQLYLALRLAALEHQADIHETVPVLMDDVLINFDDRRSKAALEVLTRVASRTQILFFTHHEALRDQAVSIATSQKDTIEVIDLG